MTHPIWRASAIRQTGLLRVTYIS